MLPLGHFHLESCWPFLQPLRRGRQTLDVSTLQHLNPSTVSSLRLRLFRPNTNTMLRMTPAPGCKPDEVACRNDLWRTSLSPLA